jgi:hypothetical protein
MIGPTVDASNGGASPIGNPATNIAASRLLSPRRGQFSPHNYDMITHIPHAVFSFFAFANNRFFMRFPISFIGVRSDMPSFEYLADRSWMRTGSRL